MIYIILVFTEYAYKNKLDDETSDNTAIINNTAMTATETPAVA